MDRLGVAFIGSGFIARFMAQSWTSVRGADITAVYNPHENGAKKLAAYIESLGLPRPKIYTDLHATLEDKSVNVAWIMNPNYARLETAKAIAEEPEFGADMLVALVNDGPVTLILERSAT